MEKYLNEKEVVCVDNQGNITKEYDSIDDACRTTFLSKYILKRQCNSKNIYSKLYDKFWFYKDDYTEEIKNQILKIDEILERDLFREPVLQFSLYGELIKEYKSIDEACRINKINRKDILKAVNINSFRSITKKSIWIFKKDFTIDILNKKIKKIKIIDKQIVELDIDGELLNVFDSITHTAKSLNIDRSALNYHFSVSKNKLVYYDNHILVKKYIFEDKKLLKKLLQKK